MTVEKQPSKEDDKDNDKDNHEKEHSNDEWFNVAFLLWVEFMWWISDFNEGCMHACEVMLLETHMLVASYSLSFWPFHGC